MEVDVPDEDLSCIHWGYLNIMQFNDVAGKRMKRYSWQTFWVDLCGSTLRLYKDRSLPSSDHYPPATMIGPRPEDQIKHAFFSLRNGSIKDFDACDFFQKLAKKQKVANLGRKNTLQINLADSSVYFLQAPTMSALYRWRTKIQCGIDNADVPDRLYDKKLLDAKMAIYERQRCYVPPEPTYPEVQKPAVEEDDYYPPECPPCDPHIIKLKEKLVERRHLLRQLEKQEKDFLGLDEENHEDTMTRIEFLATAKQNYYLVIGRPETLIIAGKTFSVFGRLGNGRWRCSLDREGEERTSCDDSKKVKAPYEDHNEDISGSEDHSGKYPYPLIGSVPTSVIVELCQQSSIKDLVDSLSVSSNDSLSDVSLPRTPPQDTSPHVTPKSSPPSTRATHVSSEPYSNHQLSRPAVVNQTAANHSPPPTRPTRLLTTGNLDEVSTRVTLPSDSSPMSPTSPMSLPDTPTQTVSSAMSDLNQALESLSLLTPRSRVSSGVSTCSRTSTSSQEDDSTDMSRGSRLELVSDDDSSCTGDSQSAGVVRRRKKRDIHIYRKLHAKGISLVVGSSSSSEDEEDDVEPRKEEINKSQNNDTNPSPSRKIEELHASKEKLTEKGLKGPKSTLKAPNGDRGNVIIDKPTVNNDLLRDFSENSCYGLPVRNSVTQAQFKPLSSHEIPPPLHQRRTLQMTRKENEGFGFVLQTHTIVQTGAYSDSMTFVSNVSEDGPAYLAGMRPGDVIIEVENVIVEDDDQQMIVDSLKNAGVTVRLVVIYKDSIRLMRLSTRLMALKARLQEAEAAYDALESKEKLIQGGVKDPSVVDVKVRVALIHIHIQIASHTFARDSPAVKNTVTQSKRTPTELLEVKQSPSSDICGAPTAGFDLVREFASTCQTDSLERDRRATSPKYASDTALNTTKKRKVSETSARQQQKTIKQCQRSSFISYIDLEGCALNDTSRRRIKSEGNESDDELCTSEGNLRTDQKASGRKAQTLQPTVARPESYMFAVGSQNAIHTNLFKSTTVSRIAECNRDADFV